ncbi:MAG TPA: prepilin-type N-terminal cleavage/methylation domain-containing protein [Gemmatimonadaceae bacterium]|jgi:prepilin-type N-terminal cleavage/methylation domain-containing protein
MINSELGVGRWEMGASAGRKRVRRGLSLVEVIVAMSILSGVLLALGLFSARLSQATSGGRIRIAAAQLASDRLEQVKTAPRYSVIESTYVATENSIANFPGYSRRTWVQRVGGSVTDTIDYKIITVQVTHAQLAGNVRKTTVIAPF